MTSLKIGDRVKTTAEYNTMCLPVEGTIYGFIGPHRAEIIDEKGDKKMYEKYKVDFPTEKIGDWEIKQFEVTKEQAENERLRSIFNGGRGVPKGKYTALKRNSIIIMSDTPDEIRDHLLVIHRAKGNILINGLGLGMVAQACLEKEEVNHVTIIEKSLEVINLVGKHLINKYGDRVLIIHGDAFEYKPPKNSKYDVVWHDIWDDLCSDNLPEMHKLHRKYGRRCTWQGSWGRSYCENQRRRGV